MSESNIRPSFYQEHLGEKADHEAIIKNFEPADIRGSGVVNYLKKYALRDEIRGTVRTYLIREVGTGELVGFYSICAGKILQRQFVKYRFWKEAVSGIELFNFAVNNAYKERHPYVKTIGARIFVEFILPKAQLIQNELGAGILYLYALPEPTLISYYTKLGFSEAAKNEMSYIHRHCKPSYDRSCKFMFMVL